MPRDAISKISSDEVLEKYKDSEILTQMNLINSCFHKDSGNKKIKALMASSLRNHIRGTLSDQGVVTSYRETLRNHVSFQGMS